MIYLVYGREEINMYYLETIGDDSVVKSTEHSTLLTSVLIKVLNHKKLWVQQPLSTLIGNEELLKSYVIIIDDSKSFIDTYFKELVNVKLAVTLSFEEGEPDYRTYGAIFDWVSYFITEKLFNNEPVNHVEFWHEYMSSKSLKQEEAEGHVTKSIFA